MIARASGALLFAYFVVAGAGVVFLAAPSPVLQEVSAYQSTVIIWALFYLVGGLTAAACIIVRKFIQNTLPLWYFEIGGISLIITANVIYAYAIAQTAVMFDNSNVLAAAFVILAFAGGLVARCVETFRLVTALKQYSSEERAK